MAAPNVVMLAAQVAINVLEAYFVGWLGADALAGVSVTFPLLMLMQTMSAGGMGGGVASAVARALGAGLLGLSPALIFGWSPRPRLGVRGAAIAIVAGAIHLGAWGVGRES